MTSGNVAPMFYPLFCPLFVIRTYDDGQRFHFYHKTKHKAADKTLEHGVLKEVKATCKNSGAKLKQQKSI